MRASRMSDLGFRMMVGLFVLADLFSPRRGKLTPFGLLTGQTVVDYGCGPGRDIAEAATLVGPTGIVYAVDIHPLAVDMVRRKASKANLPEVRAVLADGYTTPIAPHVADVIYALDMFHSVGEPEMLLREFHRLVKPGGVLFLEDGHQSRDETRRKVQASGSWEISAENEQHLRCIPKVKDKL